MYVTRPRSLYKSSPEAIFDPTPEGPNSGYLVISQSKTMIKAQPLPQNKICHAKYGSGDSVGSSDVLFISVINQPLSSNRYYMIYAEGEHQGLAYGSSTKEEDTETSRCCCCTFTYIAGRKPRRLNPLDTYQQFEITIKASRWSHHVSAKSVAPDGVVTSFISESCEIYPSSSSKHEKLEFSGEAPGLDSTLRNSLPGFDFPLARERTPVVVVGKWVCPFMFIREGRPKERMKKSMFYEMTLEQRWERVFACENTDGASSVGVKVVVETEVVKVNGKDGVVERDEDDGVVWFWSVDDEIKNMKVGLSLVVVERMMWEQERVGWVKGDEKNQVVVGKVEKFNQGGNECCSWRRYGSYVLVERFVLKRMDGSLVLSYEFKHTQQMKSKWE